MIVTRKIQGLQKLADFFRGTPVASATNLTNTAGSPNIGVPAAADGVPDFTDVVVGDRIYISGENTATEFLVLTKTDNENLVLDSNVVAAHTADGIWRATKADGIDPAGLDLFTAVAGEHNAFLVAYDSSTFGA